jgi:endonuclease/exonuclease/phosphatase family metal-dependent hydrolase
VSRRGILAFISFTFFVGSALAAAAGLPALQWDSAQLDPDNPFLVSLGQEQMLARFERTPGLRVFWWNIEGGNTNQQISSGGCPNYRFDHPLEHNLVALSHSSIAPDVIGMGEYTPGVLQPWAQHELERIYPYHFYTPYSATAGGGIGVFSRVPLSPHAPEALAWEAGKTTAEKLVNRDSWIKNFPSAAGFDRPYLRYETAFRGRTVNLVVEHLANPWPGIQQAKREALPGWLTGAPLVGPLLSRVCAAALTGQDIFFDDDSPLSIQANELHEKLIRDFGPGIDAAPVLLTGDLNAPTKSSVHRLLTRKMGDAFGPVTRRIPNAQSSFPASCAASHGAFPELKIDHALISRKMKSPLAQVLRLHGSDHYPFYVIVEPTP